MTKVRELKIWDDFLLPLMLGEYKEQRKEWKQLKGKKKSTNQTKENLYFLVIFCYSIVFTESYGPFLPGSLPVSTLLRDTFECMVSMLSHRIWNLSRNGSVIVHSAEHKKKRKWVSKFRSFTVFLEMEKTRWFC